MRFVATKTIEQQSCLMLHRTRHLFIRQQTAVINAIRVQAIAMNALGTVGMGGLCASSSWRAGYTPTSSELF
jgi:transposase